MIISLLRKPLASNTLGSLPCGVLAIDATRVPLASEGEDPRLGGKGTWTSQHAGENVYRGGYAGDPIGSSVLGRFPANVILTDATVEGFPSTPSSFCATPSKTPNSWFSGGVGYAGRGYRDAVPASRYFKRISGV
jgi:hypothetical protein